MEWDGRNGLYKHMVNNLFPFSIALPIKRKSITSYLLEFGPYFLGPTPMGLYTASLCQTNGHFCPIFKTLSLDFFPAKSLSDDSHSDVNRNSQADNVPEGRRASAFGILSGISSCGFVCGTLSTRFLSTATTFQVLLSFFFLESN